MKVKVWLTTAVMATGVVLTLTAFAEDATPSPQALAEQCKQEAIDSGIQPADISAYVNECLTEHGVDDVEVEIITNQIAPTDQSSD